MPRNRKYKRLLIHLAKGSKSPYATNISRMKSYQTFSKFTHKIGSKSYLSISAFNHFLALISFSPQCILLFGQRRLYDRKHRNCIKLGDSKKSILGSPTYQGYFIAILMIKQWKKTMKKKINSLVIMYAIRQGLKKIFRQVN